MLYQEAKRILPQSKVREIATQEVYVVEKIQVSEHPMKVMIYGREVNTRKPKCFDHRKVEKYSLIQEIREREER